MINFNVNFRKPYGYYYPIQSQNADFDEGTSCNAKGKEVITTWKYDEEGNIVYYTIDKKTGEIITKTKYKNPYKDIIQPKRNLI